jgi:hypothetical protein
MWAGLLDWALGPKEPQRGRPHVIVLIQVQHQDGTMQPAYARVYDPRPDETDFYVTVYEDGKACNRQGACTLCAWYDYNTGRHITWGQGRYDLDEFPCVTPKSMMKIHATREMM